MNTPHSFVRNFVTLLVIGSLLTLIFVGLFSCTKQKPLDKETVTVEISNGTAHSIFILDSRFDQWMLFSDGDAVPADLSLREWTQRLVYPNHEQGCDTSANGGL